jgi:hypothetical protein
MILTGIERLQLRDMLFTTPTVMNRCSKKQGSSRQLTPYAFFKLLPIALKAEDAQSAAASCSQLELTKDEK